MSDNAPAPNRPLVPISRRDSEELIALALNLTKGRERQHAIAREANSALAEQVLEYFEQSGIVLMRPPPRPPWSNNPDHNGPRIPLKD